LCSTRNAHHGAIAQIEPRQPVQQGQVSLDADPLQRMQPGNHDRGARALRRCARAEAHGKQRLVAHTAPDLHEPGSVIDTMIDTLQHLAVAAVGAEPTLQQNLAEGARAMLLNGATQGFAANPVTSAGRRPRCGIGGSVHDVS
jgi:hypothetical protein